MKKPIHYLILFITCLWLLLSCMSAGKHLDKAVVKDKPLVAKLTRDLFPCTILKTDTVSITDTAYEFLNVLCPDARIDSFETSIPVYVKIKVPELVTKTIRVTERFEDSAKIYLLNKEISDKEKVLSAKNLTISDLTNTVQRKNKTLKWLWLILAALSIPYIIKLVRIIKL